MSKFLLMMLLLFGSFAAHAQVQVPGCPPGVVPGQPGCGGSDEDSSVASTYKGPVWQDRFGAIAASSTTTAGGAAANMSSARAARNKALRDCGVRDCKVRIEARNSCIATAWGGGISSFVAKPNQQEAESAVMEQCSKNGTNAKCTLDYSACSLPVRVR